MFNSMRDRGDRDRLQETLDAYLDNALTPAERARFEAALRPLHERFVGSTEQRRLIARIRALR